MDPLDKVAIVGAGRVGSTFAYALATSGLVRDIVLIDKDTARAQGEAMDIAHAVPFHRPVGIRAGGFADAAGAVVTVITAGAAQQPGETRPALLQRNVQIMRPLIEAAVQTNPAGLLLIATNPVDALTFFALEVSGLPAHQVIGSGTVLDSARLRAELSRHYGVDARSVHAYVLGEHGDSEVVAWSAATLGNVRLLDYCGMTGMACGPEDMRAIDERVRNAAQEIIRRKGATNFAIASALTRIVEAVMRDEASVLTVSTLLNGEYGIDQVCLSLPALIGRRGVLRVLPVPLHAHEVDAIRKSAAGIRAAMQAAGMTRPV